LEVEACLVQRTFGAVDDAQVLDRQRVPVLQATKAEAPSREVPPPADRLDRFEGSHAALGQPVECEPPPVTAVDKRKLLDLKIFGQALQLHRGQRRPRTARLERGRTRSRPPSARDSPGRPYPDATISASVPTRPRLAIAVRSRPAGRGGDPIDVV